MPTRLIYADLVLISSQTVSSTRFLVTIYGFEMLS
jgi:hypothetical protein